MHHKSLLSVLLVASVAQFVIGCGNIPGLDPNGDKAKSATINVRLSPPATWTVYDIAKADTEPVDHPTAGSYQQQDTPQAAKDKIAADVKKYVLRVLQDDKLPASWLKNDPKFAGTDEDLVQGTLQKDCKTNKDDVKIEPLADATKYEGADYAVNSDNNVIIECNKKTLEPSGDIVREYPIAINLIKEISDAKWGEMAAKLQAKMEQYRFKIEEISWTLN